MFANQKIQLCWLLEILSTSLWWTQILKPTQEETKGICSVQTGSYLELFSWPPGLRSLVKVDATHGMTQDPWRIHVWYIYLHFTMKNEPNVGKYNYHTLSVWAARTCLGNQPWKLPSPLRKGLPNFADHIFSRILNLLGYSATIFSQPQFSNPWFFGSPFPFHSPYIIKRIHLGLSPLPSKSHQLDSSILRKANPNKKTWTHQQQQVVSPAKCLIIMGT